MPAEGVNKLTPYQVRTYTCDAKYLKQISTGKVEIGSAGEAERIKEEATQRKQALVDGLLERMGCQLH